MFNISILRIGLYCQVRLAKQFFTSPPSIEHIYETANKQASDLTSSIHHSSSTFSHRVTHTFTSLPIALNALKYREEIGVKAALLSVRVAIGIEVLKFIFHFVCDFHGG